MRILFASDLHGSTRCWLKFLASGKFYGADAIVVGGDITGKFLSPIIRQPDGMVVMERYGTRVVAPEAQIEALKKQASDGGSYTFETTATELAELKATPGAIDDLFMRLILERVDEWVLLADDRLVGQQIRCFVNGGNDDAWEVDERLQRSRRVEVPQGQIVEIGHGLTMLTLGYSNVTPWHCPRDISEEELAARIDELATQVHEFSRAIFDIHVPPFGSGLDLAPKLDGDFNIVKSASGEVQSVPVGSTAVRDAILRYQPLLSLHGHVHESPGIQKLGRTTAVNPGSEYQAGLLRGALIEVDLNQSRVTAQLVAG